MKQKLAILAVVVAVAALGSWKALGVGVRPRNEKQEIDCFIVNG